MQKSLDQLFNTSNNSNDMHSIGTESYNGGSYVTPIMEMLFSSKKHQKSNKIIDLFNQKDFPKVIQIISNPDASLTETDENGYTVLHHFVKNFNELFAHKQLNENDRSLMSIGLLSVMLQNDSIKRIINAKTKTSGDTAVLLAGKKHLPPNVISMLIDAGADMTISDNKHNYMATKTDADSLNPRQLENMQKEDDFDDFDEPEGQHTQKIDDVLKHFLIHLEKSRDVATSTAGIGTFTLTPKQPSCMHINISKTSPEQLLPKGNCVNIFKQTSESKQKSSVNQKPVMEQKSPQIVEVIPGIQATSPQKPLPIPPLSESNQKILKKEELAEVTNTSEFVQKLINDHEMQQLGGNKSSVIMQRKLNLNSEYNSLSASMSGGSDSQLSRLINDQSKEIHDRTIKNITKEMNVDDEKAKLYYSSLYWKVKTEHPEYPRVEKALEIEKLATKENLKGIDIVKQKEINDKYKAEHMGDKPAHKSKKSGEKPVEPMGKKTTKSKKVMKNSPESSDSIKLTDSDSPKPERKPRKKTARMTPEVSQTSPLNSHDHMLSDSSTSSISDISSTSTSD